MTADYSFETTVKMNCTKDSCIYAKDIKEIEAITFWMCDRDISMHMPYLKWW